MSSVAARFFPPQVGGAGATVGQTGLPFRIDHDEKYNETTHFQYQIPGRHSPVVQPELAVRQRAGCWERAVLWNDGSQQPLPALLHDAERPTRDHEW